MPEITQALNFQDASTETLFGTLNNTLRLLEMGFSEKDISAAIDMCGE